ncbi:MAG TPA: hypothetical protein VJ768_02225 [Anaerolineales bacterium]|nr:hypothetical protein [Anaerolineales bacterium]
MQRRSRELWMALAAILVISLLYLFVAVWQGSIPAASNFFGHSLGILGFLLMLMTETLYSLRKRSRQARWGSMAGWLQFHIFTGLVGPYLVLLHTSWKFNGLAGILMLLTIVIVASGIIGRYIYTAVPRTADGAALESAAIEVELARLEADFQETFAAASSAGLSPSSSSPGPTQKSGFRLIFGRGWDEARERLRGNLALRRMEPGARPSARKMGELQRRRRELARQKASLAMARQTLALWHSIHIPIGVVLFTVAFIHIGAAIYYATLLR